MPTKRCTVLLDPRPVRDPDKVRRQAGFNRAMLIPEAISSLRTALPETAIPDYDNNSSDRMRLAPCSAAALVRSERLQGAFALTGAEQFMAGLGLGLPVVLQLLPGGMSRLPSGLLATRLALALSLSLLCGSVLEQSARAHRELEWLAHFSIPTTDDRA